MKATEIIFNENLEMYVSLKDSHYQMVCLHPKKN